MSCELERSLILGYAGQRELNMFPQNINRTSFCADRDAAYEAIEHGRINILKSMDLGSLGLDKKLVVEKLQCLDGHVSLKKLEEVVRTLDMTFPCSLLDMWYNSAVCKELIDVLEFLDGICDSKPSLFSFHDQIFTSDDGFLRYVTLERKPEDRKSWLEIAVDENYLRAISIIDEFDVVECDYNLFYLVDTGDLGALSYFFVTRRHGLDKALVVMLIDRAIRQKNAAIVEFLVSFIEDDDLCYDNTNISELYGAKNHDFTFRMIERFPDTIDKDLAIPILKEEIRRKNLQFANKLRTAVELCMSDLIQSLSAEEIAFLDS